MMLNAVSLARLSVGNVPKFPVDLVCGNAPKRPIGNGPLSLRLRINPNPTLKRVG
jgi:hypothetical protein